MRLCALSGLGLGSLIALPPPLLVCEGEREREREDLDFGLEFGFGLVRKRIG